MKLRDLIEKIDAFFSREKIDYFAFGGVALSAWVTPRTTADLDVVVAIAEKQDAYILLEKLNTIGGRFTTDYAAKLLAGRVARGEVGGVPLDIKLAQTDFDRAALARAVYVAAEGVSLKVATPEDLILYKLQTWRTQDRADVERLAAEYEVLDTGYIESWLGPLSDAGGADIRARWKEVSR